MDGRRTVHRKVPGNRIRLIGQLVPLYRSEMRKRSSRSRAWHTHGTRIEDLGQARSVSFDWCPPSMIRSMIIDSDRTGRGHAPSLGRHDRAHRVLGRLPVRRRSLRLIRGSGRRDCGVVDRWSVVWSPLGAWSAGAPAAGGGRRRSRRGCGPRSRARGGRRCRVFPRRWRARAGAARGRETGDEVGSGVGQLGDPQQARAAVGERVGPQGGRDLGLPDAQTSGPVVGA